MLYLIHVVPHLWGKLEVLPDTWSIAYVNKRNMRINMENIAKWNRPSDHRAGNHKGVVFYRVLRNVVDYICYILYTIDYRLYGDPLLTGRG